MITTARRWKNSLTLLSVFWTISALPAVPADDAKLLPDQELASQAEVLKWDGDLASRMVDGADRFLLRQTEASLKTRQQYWTRDTSSPTAYETSVEKNRKELARILGVVEDRVPFSAPELIATTEQAALLGETKAFKAWAVRWPVFGGIYGEGVLLTPKKNANGVDVIAVPDADQTPEQLCGLEAGLPMISQSARRLAEHGCRVLVPALISRELKARNNRARMTHREFVYRTSFEMGRHVIGYEIQKIFAAVDWFAEDRDAAEIGVMGYGEGGLLALHAAALDRRIQTVGVSGYFSSRQTLWQEPVSRNVFGYLKQFGNAEVMSLVAPRSIIIEATRSPEITLPSSGGAPGKLVTPDPEDVQAEFNRSLQLVKGLKWQTTPQLILSPSNQLTIDAGRGPFGSPAMLTAFLKSFDPKAINIPDSKTQPTLTRKIDHTARQHRMVSQINDYNQTLLRDSGNVRREFFKNIDTSSLEAYQKSIKPYRDIFRNDIIGQHSVKRLPANPKIRGWKSTKHWTGYEVALDVFPDVFAYGILLVPKSIEPNGKRPVVVCQHGLEGRPEDTIEDDHRAYHDFASELAKRGFVVFAPQNPYRFQDRFRTLQRKSNPLGTTLFSLIVPQHQQIVNWLQTLSFVDGQRIGFYGLSYGGKSAMRIPPLVEDYALSICSADFNEWIWKNISIHAKHSYVWTGEYEIFEFNLGQTFNYAEMAALIAPRPFMVERGHFDGVAPDEQVGYEYAKVRNLYQAKLGIGDRTEIEWFVGPHTINGKGTFNFLHKHLKWPQP